MIGKGRHKHLSADGTVPWLPYEAILFLDSIVSFDWTVFEWGSGASTFWLAKRCAKVLSVESDRRWSLDMQVLAKGFDNIELMGITSQDDPTLPKDYRRPDSFRNDKGVCFKDYVQQILEYPDETFDLVYVDGKARPSCLITALPKVKPGGYILLDNTDHRKYWKAMDLVPVEWDRTDFIGLGRKDPTAPALKQDMGRTVMSWKCTIWKKED